MKLLRVDKVSVVVYSWYCGQLNVRIRCMRESLRELRINIGWSQKILSEKSGVDRGTISRAEKGAKVGAVKAKALADALSVAYGREIRPLDIEGLDIE